MIKLLIVILPFLLSSVGVSCLQRKLTYKTDPGCGDKCKDVAGTLIHVTAAGPNDTIHHVWDFFHKPTVFLALTPVNTTLTVDWDRFLQKEAHSWKLSHKHQYAFAYVIDKVIEYNDVNDIAYYQPSAEKRVLSADAFHWTLEDVVDSSDSIVVELKGVYAHGNESEQSGHIRVKLSAFGTQQYSNSTPHLYHTANATGMDIVFDNLPVSFNHSRYALELGIFNTNEDHGITPLKTKELDDEHTPGVFTVAELLTTHKEQFSGFLQWKTVSYKSPERLMTSSTDVNDSIPTTINHPEKSFHDSGVYSYFGQELDKISANSIYVSFGEPLDNYYNGTRYLTWTFLAGIGQPVEESFSLMVVLILILGLAAAGTLVIITGGCIISRLVSRTRDQLLS